MQFEADGFAHSAFDLLPHGFAEPLGVVKPTRGPLGFTERKGG